MKPVRIQRKRSNGWKMPPNTVAVDRSTKWGNPFIVSPKVRPGARSGCEYVCVPTVEDAIDCFREYLKRPEITAALNVAELRGKNLACWCKLDAPCHADVLLELANEVTA
jgi:hypothetical protein